MATGPSTYIARHLRPQLPRTLYPTTNLTLREPPTTTAPTPRTAPFPQNPSRLGREETLSISAFFLYRGMVLFIHIIGLWGYSIHNLTGGGDHSINIIRRLYVFFNVFFMNRFLQIYNYKASPVQSQIMRLCFVYEWFSGAGGVFLGWFFVWVVLGVGVSY